MLLSIKRPIFTPKTKSKANVLLLMVSWLCFFAHCSVLVLVPDVLFMLLSVLNIGASWSSTWCQPPSCHKIGLCLWPLEPEWPLTLPFHTYPVAHITLLAGRLKNLLRGPGCSCTASRGQKSDLLHVWYIRLSSLSVFSSLPLLSPLLSHYVFNAPISPAAVTN